MLKNYIRIAFRNLLKSKAFAIINIFGLSVGLTSCTLICLYVTHEYSYDKEHKYGERLYQLGAVWTSEGEAERRANVPAAMVTALEAEFPEIEESAKILQLFGDDKTLLQTEEPGGGIKSFYETGGY